VRGDAEYVDDELLLVRVDQAVEMTLIMSRIQVSISL
jgi:hypothetical protein